MDQWWWCKELRVGTLEAESTYGSDGDDCLGALREQTRLSSLDVFLSNNSITALSLHHFWNSTMPLVQGRKRRAVSTLERLRA